MEIIRDVNLDRLHKLCLIYIGITTKRRETGGLEVITKEPLITKNTEKEPIRVTYTYYPNSIEEYRYLLFLSNRTGSRSGLSRKRKSAERGVKFLQYAKSQEKFMEYLSKTDEITFKRVLEYSNPIILKTPLRLVSSVIPDGDISADQPIRTK